jgi:hypothetical protein
MVVAVVGLAACGSGEELGEEDAATAWPTTQKALSGGTSSSSAPGALTSTTFTHDCADGGKAKFEASVDTSIDLGDISPTNTATTVDYTVTFKKCKVDGVVTVGDLAFTLETNTSDTGAETVWTYDGDLAYRGDVKGTCLVDMTGRAAANLGGASLEYEGSVCGNDAALTLNAGPEGASVDGSIDGDDVSTGI